MHRIIIIQALAHVHKKHLDLAVLPTQALHERALADARQPFHDDHAQEPDALFALPAVAGPAADRKFVADLGNVLEALGAEEIRDTCNGVLVEPQA